MAFYKELYSDSGICRPKLDGMVFPQVEERSRAWLERLSPRREVKSVVWGFKGDKVPGSDGFSMAFYKTCWEVVKEDLMETIEDFVISDFLDYDSNATFISLVPKKGGVSQIRVNRDFLNYMMRRMSFGLKWRNWMKQCYGPISFSILLNGESFNYFKSSRDFRQGDPLSPFLFLIVVEAFGAMLAKAFQG